MVSARSGAPGNRGVLGLILGALLLIGTVCCIYGRGLHAPFLFDDAASVINNPSLVQLWPRFRSDRYGGPLNPPMWATSDIIVEGRQPTPVALTLQSGMTVSGKLAFDGAASETDSFQRSKVILPPLTPAFVTSIGYGLPVVAT